MISQQYFDKSMIYIKRDATINFVCTCILICLYEIGTAIHLNSITKDVRELKVLVEKSTLKAEVQDAR